MIFVLLVSSSAIAAVSDAEYDAFREAMIARDCVINSSDDAEILKQELGFSKETFSEAMLWLSLTGELVCLAGCELISKRCP